ncbi:MAG: GNAT family protein [Deltaproteobacteria bacterium]|nr:GNAT family protein [Deltaproteobacteria bacterium]
MTSITEFKADRALVELVPLESAHVDHIMSWVNDRDIVGNLAAFSGKPFTRDDELQYIAKMIVSKEDRVFSIFAPAIKPEDRKYLGQCGIHQIFRRSRVARASLIVADRSDMGKGVGSAALARLLDVAFSPPPAGEGLHKIWLMCFRENERARRTYTRLGFIEEGILREEYLHEDRHRDMVRMSVLAREWTLP